MDWVYSAHDEGNPLRAHVSTAMNRSVFVKFGEFQYQLSGCHRLDHNSDL
jgi:hypothetical protein